MFHSGESRWFFKRSLPDDVRNWMRSDGQGIEEPSRADQYLLIPHCKSTSVKFREGNLEVKANTKQPTEATFTNGVRGYQDAWVKWSCKAEDEVDTLRRIVGANEDLWASVQKSRFLRKISLDDGKPKEVDAANARPDRGCQVELTSIKVIVGEVGTSHSESDWAKASSWWSISLEAFAPSAPSVREDVLSHLTEVANLLFQNAPPCRLDLSSSLSYPEWLLAVAN